MNFFFRKAPQGVGIDLIDVSRFIEFENNRNHPFLKKVFFDNEIEYCFSYKNPSVHLAGTFAAKEAASKALGISKYPFSQIEIRRRNDGAPEAFCSNIKLRASISISHTSSLATAIAVTNQK